MTRRLLGKLRNNSSPHSSPSSRRAPSVELSGDNADVESVLSDTERGSGDFFFLYRLGGEQAAEPELGDRDSEEANDDAASTPGSNW